jgi:hypothetical protein
VYKAYLQYLSTKRIELEIFFISNAREEKKKGDVSWQSKKNEVSALA